MNRKKYDYFFLVFFAVSVLFAYIVGSGLGCSFENRTRHEGAVKINMEFEEKSGNFYYEFTLPDMDITGKNLAYNTSYFSSEVFIDGVKIYECRPFDESRTHSTGYRWNFIKLSDKDAGKNIVIHQKSPYKNISPDDTLYFGETSDIYKAIFTDDGLRMTLAVIILVVGIILMLYSVFILKLNYADSTPVFFSVFSILLAVWAATNLKVCSLLFSDTLVCTMLNHYSLMLMPVAFLQFLRQIYTDKENILWDITQYAGTGLVIIRTVLDVFRIAEMRETLWITQVYIFVFAVVGIVLGVKEFVTHRVTRRLRINIICLIIILAATLLEIMVLKLFNKDSSYGMFCFIIYVVIMAANIVKESQKIKKRANEAEIYKNLAFTDELTGVFNRTAFRADMDKLVIEDKNTGENKIIPVAVFIFDLNDLKKCNDQFGHENGDIYISSVSKIISEAFGVDGKCYRIGGDEFCVLMQYTGQNEIDSKLRIIQKKIRELNRKKFVVNISVAAGYAVYDENIDEDLDATMKRADTMMYENKQKFKQNRQNGI